MYMTIVYYRLYFISKGQYNEKNEQTITSSSVVNKDLTFKAKDSKFVLEDTPRPRTTTLTSRDSKDACNKSQDNEIGLNECSSLVLSVLCKVRKCK